MPLFAIRARRKGYEVSTMKAMMEMVGLNAGPVRPPLVNVTPEEEDELRAILSEWENFCETNDSAFIRVSCCFFHSEALRD